MMKIDPESWPILSRLLDEWLDLPDGSRAAWLANLGPQYAGILPLLREVIANQASIETEDFLKSLPRFEGSAVSGTTGALIGPYRLVRELGRGGMGVVWLAERADGEVKRPVALKLPMVSMHRRLLAERFARERDILAQLTHPQIARLYDAGVSNEGQPYLAIEYVEGEKLTTYCDNLALNVSQRLHLFLQVLHAVQFAHANLIVHRDLKPANILVTKEGEVRLLDFGIAKLLTEGQATETELTQIAGRALTPDYASPEQIAGNAISTASDVYSLGVVLYEILTGARPYKLKRDTRSSLEEAIIGAEPARPSQAADKSNAESYARSRGVTAKKLERILKGDLDAIVLKALNKQPAKRYVSADAFAQDIERYLGGEAVLAQPESPWYRARKFVVRNKLAVGAGVVVVAALTIGFGVAWRQAHEARIQTRTAETVRAFLLDIFRTNSNEHADPVKARQTTARDLLDIGAKKIDDELNDAPEAKLSVLETLFRLYTDLGLQDQAVSLGRRRIALAKSVYGASHPEVARALIELASNSGESSYANDRRTLLKEAGSILDGNREARSRTRALYYLAMGNVNFDVDPASCEAFTTRAVELYRTYPPSRELVSALNLLGQIRNNRSEYAQAVSTLTEAAAIANSLQGEARGPLPAIYAILGYGQRQLMDLSGAEKSLRLAIQVARELKGDEHADVLQTKWRLGVFLAQTARPQEGLALLREAVDLALRTRGPEEVFHTPMVRRGYGLHLLRYGRAEEGLVALTQAIDVKRRANQAHDNDFANSLEFCALDEIELGHYRQASALLDEAGAIYSKLGVKPASRIMNDGLLVRAKLQVATGKAEDAERTLQDFPERREAPAKISYPWLDVSLARAEVDLARERPAPAIEEAALVKAQIAGSGLAQYFKRWEAQAEVLEGVGLMRTGRSTEALPLLRRAVQLGSAVYDPERSPELADSQVALASCLLDLGRRDEARTLLAQAKAIHATHQELGEQFRTPLREVERRIQRR